MSIVPSISVDRYHGHSRPIITLVPVKHSSSSPSSRNCGSP